MGTDQQTIECRERVRALVKYGSYGWVGLSKENPYVSMYLLVTQDCNAKCSYCYQPGAFRKKSLMSKKVADDAVKFLIKTLGDRVRFQVFGGEPLINFDTVKYIIEKYPQIMFAITTNGILINDNKEIFDWIQSQRHHLDLTISCSAQREFYGKDVYMDKIGPCLEVLKTNGGEFHFVVSDPYDEKIFDEIKALYDAGVHVKVSSANCGTALATDAALDAYLVLFKKIVDYMYFGEHPTFGLSTYDRGFKSNVAKKRQGTLNPETIPSTFCGAGHYYLAVTDTGDIYPCDYFSSFPEMKLGSIYSGLDENAPYFTRMDEWTTDLYECCKGCEIEDLRLCTRAHCLAENYEFMKHPLKPTKTHCNANILEYRLFNYMMDEAAKRNIDVKKSFEYNARSFQ